MNAIQEHDRPDWYYDSTSSGMNKRSKKLFSSPTDSDSMMTSPSNLGSNPSIKDYLLPKLTKAAQAKFEQCIAMHYYITGTSFVRVEEEHLAMAMKVLRPDAQLPTRKKMGDSLLKAAFKELKVKVDGHLANTTVCLTTDGWTNIHNNPIVTYMVTSPTTSLFLESVSTGEQTRTHCKLDCFQHSTGNGWISHNHLCGCSYQQHINQQECMGATFKIVSFCILPGVHIAWATLVGEGYICCNFVL
jgi:hypothetical protein